MVCEDQTDHIRKKTYLNDCSKVNIPNMTDHLFAGRCLSAEKDCIIRSEIVKLTRINTISCDLRKTIIKFRYIMPFGIGLLKSRLI